MIAPLLQLHTCTSCLRTWQFLWHRLRVLRLDFQGFSVEQRSETSVEYPSYSSLPLFVTFVSSPLRFSTVQRSVVTLRDKRGRFVRGRGDSGTRSGPYPIPNYKILPYSLFKICTLFSCHDVFIRVLTLLLFWLLKQTLFIFQNKKKIDNPISDSTALCPPWSGRGQWDPGNEVRRQAL